MSNEIFSESLKNGEYDAELTKVLLDWQVSNAESRIKDYVDNLIAQYDGQRLSVAPISQNHIDELLHLGRELHQETRKAYLKANLEQYLHDLSYIASPTIHITDAEWDTIHAGNIHQLEVLRNWASDKLESIKAPVDSDPTELSAVEIVEPAKRGRKAKTAE